jgi:protocatechuate 3,4-dioxygenase beta subunit
VAKGVPLTISLKVLDTASGSVGREGAAVYLWHCDVDGRYSLYSEGVTQENYLRGVQKTGGDGSVTLSAAWKPRPSGRGGNPACSLRCRWSALG